MCFSHKLHEPSRCQSGDLTSLETNTTTVIPFSFGISAGILFTSLENKQIKLSYPGLMSLTNFFLPHPT